MLGKECGCLFRIEKITSETFFLKADNGINMKPSRSLE
jgi:hypothetical protein